LNFLFPFRRGEVQGRRTDEKVWPRRREGRRLKKMILSFGRVVQGSG